MRNDDKFTHSYSQFYLIIVFSLLSVFTVPCSVFLCLRDSRNDYERWKELRSLRIRGVPDKFMPYKCKYDWTDYEKVLNKKTDK
ncbi:hypothetical protein NECAME_14752 [Necator americanus]|uniref:Uncharacterized protein n=1 Tax=Necator americanus TaxID=51031 RepID=W2SLM4_NECAM|nr:hypothetical protein NECAME_14752 [Necator americanus]ETN70443.1 hypothetical protein NECAME_14752 [Necator americanus]